VATLLNRDIQSVRSLIFAVACAMMLFVRRGSAGCFFLAISDEGWTFSVRSSDTSFLFFLFWRSCRQGIPLASAMRIILVSGIFCSVGFLWPLNECGIRISHIPAGAPLDGAAGLPSDKSILCRHLAEVTSKLPICSRQLGDFV